MIKISIVIPAYNCEKYLSECLDSIIMQTFGDWECIIVDDGSKDNTWEICKSYEKIDSRFRIYKKENGGASSARKYGVEQATGDWVFFSDSDDIIPKDSLKSLLELDDGQCDVIAGTILYEKTDTLFYTKSRELSTLPNIYIKYLLDHSTYIGPCSKLIKRNLFEMIEWNTDKHITNLEDLLMLIDLSTSLKNKVIFLNDAVNYICYTRPNSCSSRPMDYYGCKLLIENIWSVLSHANKLTEEIKIAYLKFALRLLKSMCLNHNCWFKTDDTIKKLMVLDKSIIENDISNRDKKIVFSPFYRALYILRNYVK